MTHEDYAGFDAVGLAHAIRTGAVSAEEALEAALGRLEAVNPAINAVVHRLDQRAMEQVRAGIGDEPFAGVPFLVKDLSLAMRGTAQTNGSRFFEGYVAEADSTLAERIAAAGLVVIGRTATPEFGLSPVTEPRATGPCRNPWDTGRQTGGSSGGSAAAVAAGIVPMAHATDGGGSIRMPAAHCGLFGLKPSRGRLPAGPLLGDAWSGLAVPHVVSRSVRDSAAMLDATAGPAPGDPYTAPCRGPYAPLVERDPPRLRIAFTTVTPEGQPVHPEVREGVLRTARLLESLGHGVEEDRVTTDLNLFYRHFWTIAGAHVGAAFTARAEALGREPEPDEIEPATRAIVARARRASAEDFARAAGWLQGLGRRLGAFFGRQDVMLTPVYANPPLPVGSLAMKGDDLDAYARMLAAERPFTAMFNASGGPAMSVPLHWSDDGLPIGIQFGADLGREDHLVRLAGQLERAAPWAHRRPAL